jgi:APA family basic amino acid/polyamine antiporter
MSDGLRRELNLFGAVSMIVGIVIGSGIFLGVNRVAAGAGSPWLIVLVWVVAGILTLMGALCYAELGVLFPKAGGEYVFLKEGLGSLPAFLSGWTAFTINLAGSAAALGIIFAEQLSVLKPFGYEAFVLLDVTFLGYHLLIDGVKITAAALIGVLSVINYFGVKYGGSVQQVFTALKGVLIVFLAVAALFFFGDAATADVGFFDQATYQYEQGDESVTQYTSFSLSTFLGTAMVAAFFAYDGWTNVVRVGSELKNPEKNIPKAMILGLGAIMVMYILISFGYLNVLGFQGFADGQYGGFGEGTARTVASNTAGILFGENGAKIVAGMILISVFGALNGITMSGPRVYYAMSRDKLFPKLFAKTNRHATPGWAILFQALLATVFLMLFDFNQLTDNVVFISFFFYGLAAVGLLVLRKTHPELERPYKVPFYPVLPIAYAVVAFSFVGYLLWDQFNDFDINKINRLVGLFVVALGLPMYFVYRARLVRERAAEGGRKPAPMFGPRKD